jgi:hypothetical protein
MYMYVHESIIPIHLYLYTHVLITNQTSMVVSLTLIKPIHAIQVSVHARLLSMIVIDNNVKNKMVIEDIKT